MTPKEQAQKRLAEAQARLRAAQSGAPAPAAAQQVPQGGLRVSGREPEKWDFDAVDSNPISAFAVGVTDTVTFGFADEIIAGVMTPFGERTYSENLRLARGVMGVVDEDNPNSFLAGQIAGGFVPTSRLSTVAGIGKAGTANIKRAAFEGGIMGAAYGIGSSESEELFTTERLQDGLMGGAFGAGGGFIIGTALFQGGRLAQDGYQRLLQVRQGRSPRLDLDFKPIGAGRKVADDVAEDLDGIRKGLPGAPRAAGEPNAARKALNRLTGRQSDELEPGAIASANDMLDVPKRDVLFAKLAEMTPQQAKLAAKKLTEAMESGDLTKEPHFRSIMGLDLSEFGELEAVIPEVADILHDLGKGILNKANLGSRTVKSYEARLRSRYGTDMTEDQLDSLVERVKASEGSATVGKIQMTLAGVQFARVTKDLMPRVMQGEKEARTVLAEELSKALRVSAKGQMLMSAAGRELGMLGKSNSLLFRQMADGGEELDAIEAITAKVNAAMAELDDGALNELLAQTRDLSKLDEISKILLDPIRAEKISAWMRTRNTVEAFMKSTVLTPATMVINLVGVPIHSWMRTGGARLFAEAAARQSGDVRTATIISMQRQASAAVRWQAHTQGAIAAYRRIKWEFLGSKRDILSVAGSSKGAQKASASRQAMIANGYRPPAIREFELKKRLAVTDTRAFNERLAGRAQSDMPFASLVNAMERAGAAALNTIDALGTASAKIASGSLDDYGRALTMTREVYAEMAGKATAQALDEGVPAGKLAARVQELTEEWSSLPPQEILERVEARLINGDELDDIDQMLIRRDYNAEKEAEKVLFLDGPQTRAGRTGAGFAETVDLVAGLGLLKGALIPYIATPTRIMERALGSYTPWGKFMDETKKALASSDPLERAMEQARMDLGGTILSAGMVAAATGAITITNGGYQNSANLGGAPNMRVNLPGGGFVEFGRLDPLAMGLAMGGIIGQMWKSSQEAGDQYGQDDAFGTAMMVAYGGFRDAILSKSYLTGLNDLMEAVSQSGEGSEGSLGRYYEKFLYDSAGRMIPFSGTSRQLNETVTGKSLEAVSALDRIMKVVPGFGMTLPARVDALGNEIEGRTMGFAFGTTADEDDVTLKLRDLGVNIQDLKKADPKGFDLTSDELSEIRKIRANEAYNKNGQTMKEALASLFEDPTFTSLQDRSQVQDAVVSVMGEFNEPAREIYEYQNQDYLADREAARSFKAYMNEGYRAADARLAARESALAMSLNPTRTDELR